MPAQMIFLHKLQAACAIRQVQWQKHALSKMFERGITRTAVLDAIMGGEIIEHYQADRPFPSCLILGNTQKQALHVVAAFDEQAEMAFVITAYQPDQRHFLPDCRTRR
jgi:Domain of unknown function (DUF4258)